MAKGQNKRAARRGAAEADERDDVSSIASASTGYNMAGSTELEDDEEDVFQAMLDDTFEKRGSTRERAFAGLVAALRDSVREEECLANQSTITARCVAALRKGSAQEAASAATLLGLHVLTLGLSDSASFDEARADLMKAAAQGRAAAVRVAAAEALAVATFAACEDDLETLGVMQHLASLWRQDCQRLQAAAVAGWALLFTSLRRGLSSGLVEGALEQLGALLHAGEVAVRTAAGEAIALLYSSCGFGDDAGEEGGWDEEEEEGEVAEEGAEGARGDCMSLASEGTAMSGLDEVVGRMQQLASNKGDGVRRSRKGRSALKSSFRGLVAILEGGRVPQQRVRLQHGDSLVVSTLEGGVQLNALRRFLAGGFQAHLQHNALLHGVFGFAPLQERGERPSGREKRQSSSAASKGRARDRGWERAAKAEMRGGW